MTGIEYEPGKCHPPRLFIIHKQHRISPNSGNNLFILTIKRVLVSIFSKYYC